MKREDNNYSNVFGVTSNVVVQFPVHSKQDHFALPQSAGGYNLQVGRAVCV